MAAVVLISSALFAFKPPKPALVTPAINATGLDTVVVFRWDTATYATSYTLDASRDSNNWVSLSGFPHFHGSGVNDTMDSTGGFVYSTQYFWRVNALSVDSVSDWSSIFNFTTVIKTPVAPVLLSPHDTMSGVPTNPTLTWNGALGATSYHLQASTDPHFGSTVADYPALTPTSQSLSGLDAGRTYYWRVSASNANGTGPWLTVFRFSTTAESYGSWLYSKKLYINTKASGGGASIRNKVNNFPLLVRLNPNTFGWFSQTLPLGADIRFSKSDAQKTPLHYEIERWVDVSGDLDTAEIWVRLDTVNALDSTQYIVMYWGNGSATGRSDPYGTFDVAIGYAAVWHMNETPSGSGAIKDRTLTGCNGSPTASGVTSNAGVIGKALKFDGTSGFITLDTIKEANSSMSIFDSGITVSAWVNYHNLIWNSAIMELSEDGTPHNQNWLGLYDQELVGSDTVNIQKLDWAVGGNPLITPGYISLLDTFIYVSASLSTVSRPRLLLHDYL